MEKINQKLFVAFIGIILGLALSGCQNPFLQLGKEAAQQPAVSSELLPLIYTPPSDPVYEVNFVANGGSAVASITGVAPGSMISEPFSAKDHFMMEGWFTEESLENEWDFESDTVNSNITLYAKWEFDGEQGDGVLAALLVYDIVTLKRVSSDEVVDGIKWSPDKRYLQIKDIDLLEVDDWTPIGGPVAFTGNYNGNGKIVFNFQCEASGLTLGLFGIVGSSGVVENLGVEGNVKLISSTNAAGGIVGANYIGGTIRNCYFKGSVSGGYRNGGIAGVNHSMIENCYSEGDFESNYQCGGIVGTNMLAAMVKNSYSAANCKVSVTGDHVGGITGQNEGTILNCYATGEITGGASETGGIAGASASSIRNCVALNQKLSDKSDNYIGKITGKNDGSISYNYSDSSMKVNGALPPVSGTIYDKNGGDIDDSYYNDVTWWKTSTNWISGEAWDFDDVWAWDAVKKLPVLQNVGGQ